MDVEGSSCPDLGEVQEGMVIHNHFVVDGTPLSETPNKLVYFVKPTFTENHIPMNPDDAPLRLLKIPRNLEFSTNATSQLNASYVEDKRERFFSEVGKAGKIKHSNIAEIIDPVWHTYIDGGKKKQFFGFIEKYYPGMDLRKIINAAVRGDEETRGFLREKDVIDDDNRFTLDFILSTLQDIASGMNHIHNVGDMYHGDVAPANLLVTGDSMSKVVYTDFGTAGEMGNTKFYQLGSILYRAPEVLRVLADSKPGEIPSVPVKRPGDMWGIGVIAYQLVTNGKHPFTEVYDWSELSDRDYKAETKRFIDVVVNGHGFTPPSKVAGYDRFEGQAEDPCEMIDFCDGLCSKLLQRGHGKRMRVSEFKEEVDSFVVDAYELDDACGDSYVAVNQ